MTIKHKTDTKKIKCTEINLGWI